MPSKTTERPLTAKEDAFSAAMFTIGSLTLGNGTESARKAQYKGNDNTLAMTASRLIRKDKIIAEKQRIQAGINEKIEITIEECVESLALDIRANDTNKRDKYKAMDLLGDFMGWKRDKAPNAEKQTAMLERMSSETKRLAEQLALVLTRKQITSIVVDKEA